MSQYILQIVEIERDFCGNFSGVWRVYLIWIRDGDGGANRRSIWDVLLYVHLLRWDALKPGTIVIAICDGYSGLDEGAAIGVCRFCPVLSQLDGLGTVQQFCVIQHRPQSYYTRGGHNFDRRHRSWQLSYFFRRSLIENPNMHVHTVKLFWWATRTVPTKRSWPDIWIRMFSSTRGRV